MEAERLTLDMIDTDETAIITKLNTQGGMRRRLLDIGMIEGTNIRCLFRRPSGDPTAYLIRGAVIALRSEDSHSVEVMRR